MAIDYTTIEEIINDFQLMIDDTSYDKEASVYQLRLLALQGLRELTFDVEQRVKTTTLAVSSSLQVSLPADYVKVLRVGFKGDDDEFHPLGYKSNLSLDASVQSVVSDDPYDENNPYYHTDIGKKFGIGGGQNTLGYYRVNRQDGTINFSSDLSGKTVFMEYISDGITATPGEDHIVKFNIADSFFNSDAANGVSNDTTIKIPSRSGGVITYTFKSTTGVFDATGTPLYDYDNLSSNPEATDVYTDLFNGSSIDIAESLTEVINNGHPRYHVSPNDSNITAVNNENNVFITISNLTSDPLDLLSTGGEFDSNLNDGSTPFFSVDIQSLIQLGSSGDVPKIHKFCEEALRSYMYYKYIQRKRGIPANEKQMAKKSYFNEKRLAKARMMNFNKEAAMQISRKAFKQSPKI